MKKYLILLFILLLAAPCHAAKVCTTIGGAWNADIWTGTGCTGAGNYPIAGDTARINGATTIPLGFDAAALSVTVGHANDAELIILGTLTTAGTGSLLKVGNGDLKNGTLTLGPGSVTSIEDNLYFNNGTLQTSGTTRASPAIITGTGAFGSTGVTGPRQIVNISHLSFQLAGQVTFYLQDTTGLVAGASSFSAINTVWTPDNPVVIGQSDTPNTTPITFNDSDIRPPGTASLAIQRASGGVAGYSFSHNTISNYDGATATFKVYPQLSGGMSITGNVLFNSRIVLDSAGNQTITDNFSAQSIIDKDLLLTGDGSVIDRNYFLAYSDNGGGITASASATTANPRYVRDNVFEGNYIGDRGDFYLATGAQPETHVLRNILTVTAECAMSYDSPSYDGGGLILKNNTLAATLDPATSHGGHLYACETSGPSVGSKTFASNIYMGNGAGSVNDIVGSPSGYESEVLDYSDYNSFYNVGAYAYSQNRLTITAGNTTKAIPGSYDVGLDPKFLDFPPGWEQSRGLARWNARFGSGTATKAAGIAYLLGINGYDPATKTQKGTVSTYEPSHLVEWVRYGYSPTNGVLRHAGDPADGNPTIGAMEWKNPRRTRSM